MDWRVMLPGLDRAAECALDVLLTSSKHVDAASPGCGTDLPESHRDELAGSIVSNCAARTGTVGGVVVLTDFLPIAGWATCGAAVLFDTGVTLREDLSMLLELVHLYCPRFSRAQSTDEVKSILRALGSSEQHPSSPGGAVLRSLTLIGGKHVGRKVLGALLRRLTRRRPGIPRFPVQGLGMGVGLSSDINHFSTRELGDFAMRHLRRHSTRPCHPHAGIPSPRAAAASQADA